MEYKLIMELLIQEQFKTYNRLKKLQKNFKENPCVVQGEITARIELLSKYYKKFCENNENIEKIFAKHKIDSSNEDYFKQDLAFKCELLYVSMKGELLQSQLSSSSSTSTSTDASIPAVSSAAPKEHDDKEAKESKPSEDFITLEVPNFSGEITDWLEFRSEYFAVVHSKTDLSNCQKFFALKAALPKDVFELIKYIFISQNETGYEKAWEVLEEKFSKRTLVEAYLQKLMQQPSVSSLSKSIFRFLDKTIDYLNGLQSLNVDMQNWDVLLVHILVQKLNERTKTEWYTTYSCHELPKLYDFFMFLNSKLPSNDELSERIKKFCNDGDTNDLSVCVCCKRRHPLWQCDKFECLSIDERIIFVRNKTICVRCLSTQHTLVECTKAYTCRICQNREHHYLLHKNAKRNQ